jgi:hypothetical protein
LSFKKVRGEGNSHGGARGKKNCSFFCSLFWIGILCSVFLGVFARLLKFLLREEIFMIIISKESVTVMINITDMDQGNGIFKPTEKN